MTASSVGTASREGIGRPGCEHESTKRRKLTPSEWVVKTSFLALQCVAHECPCQRLALYLLAVKYTYGMT